METSQAEIGKRLGQFVNHVGVTKRKFAQTIGINDSSLGQIIKGKNYFSIETLLDIVKVFHPKLNIHWLLTGEGEMINEDNKPLPLTDQQLNKLADKLHQRLKEKE